MKIFKSSEKCANILPNSVTSSENNSPKTQTNNRNDYQILFGDNSFNPSTSQSFCHSHTSPEYPTDGCNKDYRNYISSPHLFFLVLFLIIYVLLILLGASVFSLFEQKAEFHIRDQILRTQQTFLAKHPCVDAESLDSFVETVIKAMDSGVNLHQLNQIIKQNRDINKDIPQPVRSTAVVDNTINSNEKTIEKKNLKFASIEKLNKNSVKSDYSLKSSEKSGVVTFSIPTEYSNWEFTSSLMFVTSVVSTIGYGHISPNTTEGKVFCLVFSCIAIPFTLVFLSIIVSLLKNGPIKIFEKWLIRSIRRYFQNTPDFLIRILHLIIVTIILLLLIIVIPALVFSYVEEKWTLLDAIYYCYISLTTVGLGDLVPSVADPTSYESIHIYRICIIIYLYSGLALIMLWIAVILRIPQLNLKPFLLTEKEERDEQLNREMHNKYGTDFSIKK